MAHTTLLTVTKFFFSGTFDVCNITVSSLLTGAVCFTVHYCEGHTTNQSFVKLTCPLTQNCFFQTVKENGCFVNLPPCSYTLSATDDDVDSNDTMPAVSIQELIVTGLASTCRQYLSEAVAVTTMTEVPIGIISEL